MDLPSDVLLDVFKTLNSQDMVKMERVSRKWYDVIEENKSLWRRLILPSGKHGWDLPIFERFDEKSESGLVEISLEVGFEEEEEVIPFVELLEKSKKTLQVISITQVLYSDKIDSILSELSWKLPNLVDFRLLDTKHPLGCILLTGQQKQVDKPQTNDGSSRLKVLWLVELGTLFESHPQIFRNLKSLHLVSQVDTEDLRRILESSSKTIKHLSIGTRNLPPLQLPPLELSRLELLQLRSSCGTEYPSWMKIPRSSTIQIHNFNSSPWVSSLSTSEPGLILVMVERCPTLSVLRVIPNVCAWSTGSKWVCDELIPVLRKRNEDAEAGLERNGIRVVKLKTLIIGFKEVGPEAVDQLKGLVKDVVDLNDVPNYTIVDLR